MFGWVEFSDAERKRTSEVLNLMKAQGAVDELGLGVLRDGFADILFPGTSTLHTHARYYFLEAYIMRYLAKQVTKRGKLSDIQRNFETLDKNTARGLRRWCFDHGLDLTGIAGASFLDDDKRWLKQTPADNNWAAMRIYGILMGNEGLSFRNYLKLLAEGPVIDLEGDDLDESGRPKRSPGSTPLIRWNIPDSDYEDWKQAVDSWKNLKGSDEPGDAISLELSRLEAEQLKDAILENFDGSLYSALLKHPEDFETVEAVASWKARDEESDRGGNRDVSFVKFVDHIVSERSVDLELPESTRDVCEAAANFSALAALLHIRFNCILQEKAEIPEEERSAKSAWKNAITHQSLYLNRAKECNLDEAFKLCNVDLKNVNHGRTEEFLRESQRLIRGLTNAGSLGELDEWIVRREGSIKHGRAKLKSAAFFARTNNGSLAWYGGTEFSFRLRYALLMAKEIEQGLEGGVNA